MRAGTLEIALQADMARLVADMDVAKKAVGGAMANIEKTVASAKEALIGLGAVGLVAGFGASVRAALELADSMGKLAQRSGVAVEDLTRLQYAARLSGVATETMATGLKKLNVSIAEAASGSKEQAGAFKALGINVVDASGRMKSADRILVEMAEAFSNAEDGAGKTAVAVKLLGKAGDEMIPLLNAGAEELEKLTKEADALGVTIGKDFAKAAEQFNDNMERVKVASESWAKVIATDLVPVLNVLAQTYADNAKGATSMNLASQTLLTVLEAVTVLGADVVYVFKGIGNEIGGIAAQAAALMRGDWNGFKAIGEAMKTDAQQARKEVEAFQQSILNAEKTARELREQRRQEDRGYNPFAKQIKSDDDGKAEAARKAYEAAVKAAEDFIRKSKEEAEAVGLAKDQVRMLAAARAAALAPTAALRMEIMRSALTLDIAIKADEEKAAAEKARLQSLEALAKAEAAAAQARDDYTKTAAADLDKLVAESKALAERNRRIGMSVEAIGDLDAAKLEEQATTLEGIAIKRLDKDVDETAYHLLKAQAEELRKIAALKRQGAILETEVETARKIEEEYKRTADGINQTLTDALMRGFESGEGFAKNFRKTLVNMFKTLILRPAISFLVNPIAMGLSGILGMSTAGAAQSAGGSAMTGFAGSALGNLFGGGVGIGGAAGFMNGLSAWGSGGSVTGMFSNPGLYSGAELLGAAGPIIGGLALLATLAQSFKGETRAGGQYGYAIGGSGYSARRDKTYSGLTDGAFFLEGPSGGDPNQSKALLGVNTAAAGINSRFAALGSNTRITGFNAGYETSDKGRGGVFAGGTLTGGLTFGESGKGDNYAGTLFESTSTQSPDAKAAWENFSTDLLQASIQALQADATLPESVKKIVKDVNAEALSMDAATQLLTQVDAMIAGVTRFRAVVDLLPFDSLKTLSFDAAQGLIALAGGIDNLTNQLGSYYQNFYTEEERRAQQMANVTKVLEKANVVMPQSNAEFRALVEHYMEMGESGQEALAALLSVNQAFAELYPLATDAADGIDEMVDVMEQFHQALDDALDALRKSIDAEKERLNLQKAVQQEALAAAKAIYDIAHANTQDLLRTVATSTMAGNGRAFIANAARNAQMTGYLPDASALSEAAASARMGLGSANFKTLEDQKRATLKLAADFAKLEAVAGTQKTIAEQQLDALEAQIQALDDLYDQQEKLVNAAKGIDTSVLSVSAALAKLTELMFPNANKPAEVPTGTPMSGGPSTSTWNGRVAGSTASFTIDETGFRRYSDGSGSMLSEGELDLWRRGLLGNVPMPAFAEGARNIAEDGLGYLHRGEAVMPAPVAQRWRDTEGSSMAVWQSIDRRLANSEAKLEAIAFHTFGTKQAAKEIVDRGVAIDQSRTGPFDVRVNTDEGPVEVEIAP